MFAGKRCLCTAPRNLAHTHTCVLHTFALLQLVDAAGSSSNVVIKLGKPGAASHVLSLRPGEMVEIVIQNNRAGFNGGQYASANESLTNNRNGREQHSFHLHGHHFWQVRQCWQCHSRS